MEKVVLWSVYIAVCALLVLFAPERYLTALEVLCAIAGVVVGVFQEYFCPTFKDDAEKIVREHKEGKG